MWQLTDENLHRLENDKPEKLYFDGDLTGFGIRVRREANGRIRRKWFFNIARSWTASSAALRSAMSTSPRRFRRLRRARLSENVQTGSDPQNERKAAKKDRKRPLLNEALRYLDDRRNGVVGKRPMRDSTYRTVRRYFEKHWAALANRPVASMTDAEVKSELRKVIDQRDKQAARVAKANLSAFLSGH